jgi:hypothetical protein
MSITPQALQELMNELDASRASRKRAWANLQEIRWVLKDAAGVKLPPPAKKTIDLEGRLVKDGVRKALTQGRTALADLVPCHAPVPELRRKAAAYATRGRVCSCRR